MTELCRAGQAGRLRTGTRVRRPYPQRETERGTEIQGVERNVEKKQQEEVKPDLDKFFFVVFCYIHIRY